MLSTSAISITSPTLIKAIAVKLNSKLGEKKALMADGTGCDPNPLSIKSLSAYGFNKVTGITRRLKINNPTICGQ